MIDIQPVMGVPALRNGNILIIGDLHIGVESHLGAKGFHLVSRTKEMLNTIAEISEGCDRIIILGEIGRAACRERV